MSDGAGHGAYACAAAQARARIFCAPLLRCVARSSRARAVRSTFDFACACAMRFWHARAAHGMARAPARTTTCPSRAHASRFSRLRSSRSRARCMRIQLLPFLPRTCKPRAANEQLARHEPTNTCARTA